MTDKDAGFTEKATEEMQEKSPAEAVADDLSGGTATEASESTSAEHVEYERERAGDQSVEEAVEKHWGAGS